MPKSDFALVGVKIKSVKKLDVKEDVYCLSTNNGNFIANGIVVKNCDAVRYALATHKVSNFDKESYYAKQREEIIRRDHPRGYGFM